MRNKLNKYEVMRYYYQNSFEDTKKEFGIAKSTLTFFQSKLHLPNKRSVTDVSVVLLLINELESKELQSKIDSKKSFSQIVERIKDDYEHGISEPDVYRKYGISKKKYRAIDKTGWNKQRYKYPVQEIAKKYLSGQTLLELSKFYGVGVKTISFLLKKNGVQIRQTSKAQLKRNIDEKSLIQDYLNFMTFGDLKKKYGVGEKYIINLLKSSNVPLRGLKKFEDDEKLIETYHKLKNMAELHKVTGLSVSLIREVLKRNHVHIYEQKGENHHNWKGGLTPEDKLERKSVAYKAWRNVVLKRDNWCCRVCGSKELLQVHHIVPFIESKELRTKVTNGITLCKKCHDLVNSRESEFADDFRKKAGTDEMENEIEEMKKRIVFLAEKNEQRKQHIREYREIKNMNMQRWQNDFDEKLSNYSLRKLYVIARNEYQYVPVKMVIASYRKYHDKRNKAKTINDTLIKELYLSGNSILDIAEKTGYSGTAVQVHVRKLGITRTFSESQKNRFHKR